jgi:hypothetical protein
MDCSREYTDEEILRSVITTDSNGCPAINEHRVTGAVTPLTDAQISCAYSASLSELLRMLIVEDGDCLKLRTYKIDC